jgi:glucosylceramidase
LQRWSNGERYGKSMIHDFNNGTVGWTDWNILWMKMEVQPRELLFSHGDTRTGGLIYTPSYYYIGHFLNLLAKVPKELVV